MSTLPPSAGLPFLNAGNTVRDRMVREDDRFLWYGSRRPSKRFRRKHRGYRFVRPGGGPFQGFHLAVRKPGSKPDEQAVEDLDLGPYPEYRDHPWAQRAMSAIDMEQKSHQDYVSGQVAPWMSGALTGLTGVDPNNPGANTQAQAQYRANVDAAVGGAYDAAASAAPLRVQGTTAGASTAAPNAYLGQAMRGLSATRASTARQTAQYQASMNTLEPNMLAQSYVNALADYQKGLPAVYAEKRRRQREGIERFLAEQDAAAAEAAREQAEFEEKQRHNKATEALSAINAQTNAAIAFQRLGLDAAEFAHDSQPTPLPTDLPPGFAAVPNDDGGFDVRNDPAFDSGGSGSGSSGRRGGSVTRNPDGSFRQGYLRSEGYNKVPKGAKINRRVFNVKRDGQGNPWVQRKGTGGGGSGGGEPSRPSDIRTETRDWWEDEADAIEARGGSEDVKRRRGANVFLRYVLDNRSKFTRNGRVDWRALSAAIQAVGGTPASRVNKSLRDNFIQGGGNNATWNLRAIRDY